ncbi:MAG: hypothetical protein M3Q30_27685 [Actinomycetota bacterium]|nr:hypothetical protein [Actinomycetota bacterium]
MPTPPKPADRVFRVIAVVLLSASIGAVVAGCGGDGGAKESASSLPSSSIPGIQSLPAAAATPGTKLTQTTSAKVLFVRNQKRKGLISLAIDSVRTGSTSDLANFILNRQAKSSTPYYVGVTVTNVGGGHVGGAPVPLYGVNGHNTLLPPADLMGSFKPCQADRIPRHLGRGRAFSTCLMFLSPRHGRLTAVEFQYASGVEPVTWAVHPASAKPKKKRSH